MGRFLFGLALPSDETHCTALASLSLPVSFTSGGEPSVGKKSYSWFSKYPIPPQTANGSAWHVMEYTVVAKQG